MPQPAAPRKVSNLAQGRLIWHLRSHDQTTTEIPGTRPKGKRRAESQSGQAQSAAEDPWSRQGRVSHAKARGKKRIARPGH